MPRQQKVSQWKIGTTMSRVENPDSLSMAEPQHRLFNRGESNISTHNDFPSTKSSAQQIKDICMHYVKKCSGQYSQNKAAARYVHQMADEVLNQISGLIGQISRIESEPEAYQALLQEFRDAFPSNLQSPKQVAAKLYKLQEDYDRVVAAIDSMKISHKKELDSVASSVNDQIKAYKDGIIKERRHHKSKIDDVSVECNQKLIEERSRILAEKEGMENHFLSQMHSLEMQSSSEISHLKSRVNTLENELRQAKESVEDLDDVNKEMETEIMQLKSKLRRMEEEEGLFGSKTPRSEIGDTGYDFAAMSSDMGSVVEDFDDDKSVISSYSIPVSTFDTQTSTTDTKDIGGLNKDLRTAATKDKDHTEKTISTNKKSSSRANSQYVRMAKSMKKVYNHVSALDSKVIHLPFIFSLIHTHQTFFVHFYITLYLFHLYIYHYHSVVSTI